jgi:hypothetical protein
LDLRKATIRLEISDSPKIQKTSVTHTDSALKTLDAKRKPCGRRWRHFTASQVAAVFFPSYIMIRSGRIPPVLNRICDDTIHSALLVTNDGELLGASNVNFKLQNSINSRDPEAFGTLLADIALDYLRLGEEYAAVDAVHRNKSHMRCLLMELDLGLVGVASCLGIDCLVIAVADADAPPGLVKAKLQALAVHVQEALSPLTEPT